MVDADRDFKEGQAARYRVKTINWTYATERDGKQGRENVHANEYSFTLRNLIKFIRDTAECAEDIISIEPEKPAGQAL